MLHCINAAPGTQILTKELRMNESQDPQANESSDSAPVDEVRTDEPEAPFGGDEPNPSLVSDEEAEEEKANPGVGGYAGRDPETEMPRIPSVPETQDDSKSHDAAPGGERWGSE